MAAQPDPSLPFEISSTIVKIRPHIRISGVLFSAFLALTLGILFYAFNHSQNFHGTQSRASGEIEAPSTVGRYEKWEAVIPYKGNYSNPNDPSQADLEAVFTAPSGKQVTTPGFYSQSFVTGGDSSKETFTLVPSSDAWRIRFAPNEVGNYQYAITLKDSTGTTSLGTGSFTSRISSNPGFVRATGLHLQFDNGNAFIPLGINAPWFESVKNHPGISWGDGTFGVNAMNDMLIKNGINYYAFWTCANWTSVNIGCDNIHNVSTTNMDQVSSWIIDQMVTTARTNNLYLTPTLKEFDQNNFDFADHVKDRYFIARWGYATNIAMWDWNKEGATNPTAVSQWVQDMQSLDPYHHLTTTNQWNHYPTLGTSESDTYTATFKPNPGIDIVQTHDYFGDCLNPLNEDPGFSLFQEKMLTSDPRTFGRFGKPSFIGETGVNEELPGQCTNTGTTPSTLYAADHSGLIIKSEIWNTLLSTIGGMTPWDFLFDPTCATGGQCSWTQLQAFRGAAAFSKAIGIIPDTATLFTNDQSNSQVTVADKNLRIIGRKNAHYAVLYASNVTGLAIPTLQGAKATILTNSSFTLKGMESGTSFSITWYDTDTGSITKIEKVTATQSGLALVLPIQLGNNTIATFISDGVNPTIMPTPPATVKIVIPTHRTPPIKVTVIPPCEHGAICITQVPKVITTPNTCKSSSCITVTITPAPTCTPLPPCYGTALACPLQPNTTYCPAQAVPPTQPIPLWQAPFTFIKHLIGL